jgi:hypothetical protein
MSQLKRLIHHIHRRSLWRVPGIYIVGSRVTPRVVEKLGLAP